MMINFFKYLSFIQFCIAHIEYSAFSDILKDDVDNDIKDLLREFIDNVDFSTNSCTIHNKYDKEDSDDEDDEYPELRKESEEIFKQEDERQEKLLISYALLIMKYIYKSKIEIVEGNNATHLSLKNYEKDKPEVMDFVIHNDKYFKHSINFDAVINSTKIYNVVDKLIKTNKIYQYLDVFNMYTPEFYDTKKYCEFIDMINNYKDILKEKNINVNTILINLINNIDGVVSYNIDELFHAIINIFNSDDYGDMLDKDKFEDIEKALYNKLMKSIEKEDNYIFYAYNLLNILSLWYSRGNPEYIKNIINHFKNITIENHIKIADNKKEIKMIKKEERNQRRIDKIDSIFNMWLKCCIDSKVGYTINYEKYTNLIYDNGDYEEEDYITRLIEEHNREFGEEDYNDEEDSEGNSEEDFINDEELQEDNRYYPDQEP